MQIHNDLVFERINPKVFERCFRHWVESIIESVGAQVIPIDGKTLKGSYDRGHKNLHYIVITMQRGFIYFNIFVEAGFKDNSGKKLIYLI